MIDTIFDFYSGLATWEADSECDNRLFIASEILVARLLWIERVKEQETALACRGEAFSAISTNSPDSRAIWQVRRTRRRPRLLSCHIRLPRISSQLQCCFPRVFVKI